VTKSSLVRVAISSTQLLAPAQRAVAKKSHPVSQPVRRGFADAYGYIFYMLCSSY
jgi:hypothetical protein